MDYLVFVGLGVAIVSAFISGWCWSKIHTTNRALARTVGTLVVDESDPEGARPELYLSLYPSGLNTIMAKGTKAVSLEVQIFDPPRK